MRTTAFLATSLDGFIAREDGSVDWLSGYEPSRAEDYGFGAFMETVDTIVMGRNTFETVLSLGHWYYGHKPLLVLTTHEIQIPERLAATVERACGTPAEIVRRLSVRGASHLYVDGGKTIQGFLRDGLLSRLIVTRIPVLLGRGIPLFGRTPHDIQVRHVATRSFANGLVQSEYDVAS
jgi:dihydrofolate reductase